jgi:hypothetical protein
MFVPHLAAVCALQPVVNRIFANPYAAQYVLKTKNNQHENELMDIMMRVFEMAMPIARQAGQPWRDITGWSRLRSMTSKLDLPETKWPEITETGKELVECVMQRLRFRMEAYFTAKDKVFMNGQQGMTDGEKEHFKGVRYVIGRGLIASRSVMGLSELTEQQLIWIDLLEGMQDLMQTFTGWEEVRG